MSMSKSNANSRRDIKKFIAITAFIFIVCGALFYAISIPRDLSDISAENGVLDLTGADFTKTLFSLNGEWEFYHSQFYTPKDFTNGTAAGAEYIQVPMSWSGAGYPLKGFATYRLTIKTDEPELMLFIPEIGGSSVVWINGIKVFEAGLTGESLHETAMGFRNDYINFRPQNGQAEIIIQISNFGWYASGLHLDLTAARSGVLLGDAMLRRILLGLIIGVLLTISFYHIILFIYSKREWIYLVFALLCVTASIRFLLESNGFAMLFLPDGMGIWLTKIYGFSMILLALLIVIFTHLIFKKPTGKIVLAVYSLTLLAPLLLTVVLPYGTFDIQISYLVLPALMVAFASIVKSQRIKENPYYALFLISLIAYVFWNPFCVIVLGDRLYMQSVLTNIFLVLSQCVMLSVSYAEAKRREKELTAETEILGKLNQAKSNFLQDMSHEMKAPLTFIAVGIDYTDRVLDKDNANISKARDMLDKLRDETQRVGRMVGGMINMAEMGELGEETRSRVDFAALLRNSAEEFTIRQKENAARLRVEIADGLPDVFVVHDGFKQVLSNILNNAAEHSGADDISLTASVKEKFINVRVTDNGGGIPPELLPRVFERGVTGQTNKNGNAGYGLSISKTIIEAHGGAIDIESESGKGTTVTFAVPVYGGQKGAHTI